MNKKGKYVGGGGARQYHQPFTVHRKQYEDWMLLMTRMYKRWIDESVSGRPPVLIHPPLILIHAWNGHEGGGGVGMYFSR